MAVNIEIAKLTEITPYLDKYCDYAVSVMTEGEGLCAGMPQAQEPFQHCIQY